MTAKKEQILNAALRLFAKEGYAGTSTSKVARVAGVSEGLIFRHFKNKEGLLEAILANGAQEAKNLFADIVLSSDPKEIIAKTLELPFQIDSNKHELWRLIYALKWQTNKYDVAPYEAIRRSLSHAFEQLGYEHPDPEAEALLMIVNGAASAILLKDIQNQEEVLHSLKAKYNL